MLLASFSNFMGQPLPLVLFELIGASIVAYGLFSYLRNLNVKSQLAAKDAIIATNQQTIEAFEERLKVVEDQLVVVKEELLVATAKNTHLTEELRDWESKYKHLENFAAPALGERLIQMFERQESILDKIVNALEGIQNRIDALESKSN